MPQIEEARQRELEEAAGRVPTLEAERDAAVQRAQTIEARAAVRPQVAAKVAESEVLTARSQARVVESIVAALPVVDGKVDETALTAAIEAAVKDAEAEYPTARATTPTALFGSFGSVTESTTGGSEQLTESDIDQAVGSAFGRKASA